MAETKVQIGPGCSLVTNEWESFPTEVEVVYTEHATDHFSFNRETSHLITRELAMEIIAELQRVFEL